MARRLRRNAVSETGTTLDYSHTNDRRQLDHSGARRLHPAALPQSDIGMRCWRSVLRPLLPPASWGWAMEWNRIGRSHVYWRNAMVTAGDDEDL